MRTGEVDREKLTWQPFSSLPTRHPRTGPRNKNVVSQNTAQPKAEPLSRRTSYRGWTQYMSDSN